MKLSIRQLKYLKSLHARKYRQKYHNFMVEGVKISEEVLKQGALEIELIAATPEWADTHSAILDAHREQLLLVSPQDLKRISLLSTPHQVLLVARQPHYQIPRTLPGLALYLDGLQDPGNLGTILRIADWFGIQWVFCSPDTVEIFNPKVVQASMGAFLRVKCVVAGFGEVRTAHPEIPIYGAVLDGSDVFQTTFPPTALMVIGNESRGITPPLRKQLTHLITIPRYANGAAESLNAAVATGILCAAFKKNVQAQS
ncbi:MAG: RNA methyltransferase [Saprospiraceae bacterium]